MTTATQSEKVIDYLSVPGRTLTSKQARARFGIQKLSARIAELRSEGYNIVSEGVTYRDTGANGVKYSLRRRSRRN